MDGSVKAVLGDFGLAAHVEDQKKMMVRCGTVGYIAPELLGKAWTTSWIAET